MRISDWSSDVCSSDLAAILALVGVVNIPIIKFSVDWWSTLHQPASALRLDGPTIHPSMLWPLLIVALGFKLYYVTVLLLRIKSELVAARLRADRTSVAWGKCVYERVDIGGRRIMKNKNKKNN